MADEKVKNKKEKKKKEPGKARRWFKDFFSELRKVTWPSFVNVLKQTGIVLLVTVCFLIIMIAFDALFGRLMYEFLVNGFSTSSVTAFSVFTGGGSL